MRLHLYVYIFLLAACTSQAASPPTTQPNLRAATAIPTSDTPNVNDLCDRLNDAETPPNRIDILETLHQADETCANLNTGEALYEAYTDYGEQLAARGRITEAQAAFTAALAYTPTDNRAGDALSTGANTAAGDGSALPTCSNDEIRIARAAVPDFVNSNQAFVTLNTNHFPIG